MGEECIFQMDGEHVKILAFRALASTAEKTRPPGRRNKRCLILPLLSALEHMGVQITLLEAYEIHHSHRNDALTTPLICCLLHDPLVGVSDDRLPL